MVTKINYGNVESISGTLSEIMNELKGKPTGKLLALCWNGTSYDAIVKTG